MAPTRSPSRWQLSEGIAAAVLGATVLLLLARMPAVPGLAGLAWGHGLALLAYAAAIEALRRRGGSRPALALRAAITVVGVIGGLYFSLGRVAFAAVPWRADAWLAAADGALGLGRQPTLAFERFAGPRSVEAFSFAYGVFLPYLYASLLLSCVGRAAAENRRFVDGLVFVYALGYACYLLLPSTGPVDWLAADYRAPLQGGYFYRQMLQGVALSGGDHGAFPSLHVAVSFYLSLFELRHNRLRGLMFLPLAVGIAFATLLLRWHYAVDVLAGLALAVLALRIFSARGGPAYRLGTRPLRAQAADANGLGAAAAVLLHVHGGEAPALDQEQSADIEALQERLQACRGRPAFKPVWSRWRAFHRRLQGLGLHPADLYLPQRWGRALFFALRELEIGLIGLLPAVWVRVSLLPLGRRGALPLRRQHGAILAAETLLLGAWMPFGTLCLYGLFLAYCAYFYAFYDARMRRAWQRSRAFLLWRSEPRPVIRMKNEGIRLAQRLSRALDRAEHREERA